MTRNWETVLGLVGCLVFVPLLAWAADVLELPNGSKLDLSKQCPVCGMVVGGGLEGSATYKEEISGATASCGLVTTDRPTGPVSRKTHT